MDSVKITQNAFSTLTQEKYFVVRSDNKHDRISIHKGTYKVYKSLLMFNVSKTGH